MSDTKVSRRDFLKGIGIVSVAGLAAAKSASGLHGGIGRALQKGKKACVGEPGYAKHVAALFDSAVTRRPSS